MELIKECPVCLENFQSYSTIVIAPCNHLLCLECAQRLYQQNTSCPCCRQLSRTFYCTTPEDIHTVARHYNMEAFRNSCTLGLSVYQIWLEQSIVPKEKFILEESDENLNGDESDDEDYGFWEP